MIETLTYTHSVFAFNTKLEYRMPTCCEENNNQHEQCLQRELTDDKCQLRYVRKERDDDFMEIVSLGRSIDWVKMKSINTIWFDSFDDNVEAFLVICYTSGFRKCILEKFKNFSKTNTVVNNVLLKLLFLLRTIRLFTLAVLYYLDEKKSHFKQAWLKFLQISIRYILRL